MGRILAAFTLAHVVISLVGIGAGFVVAYGLVTRRLLDRSTAVFLAATVATSVTGFCFPFHGFTPAHATGIVSLIVLPVAIAARYRQRLAGHWRWLFVVASMFALYLNVFVLIVQSFLKLPVLRALAPTQKELPFAATQIFVLTLFVVLTVITTVRFRPKPIEADQTSLQVV